MNDTFDAALPLRKPRGLLEIDDIEKPASEYAFKRGWHIEKVKSLSANGWPDRLAIRRGRVVFIEFKRPGQQPTLQQAKRHREIRAHGGEVVWFDNLAAAMAFFE